MAVRFETSARCNAVLVRFHWKFSFPLCTLVFLAAALQMCGAISLHDAARASRSPAMRCICSTSLAMSVNMDIVTPTSCIVRTARSIARCASCGLLAFMAMFHACLADSIVESTFRAVSFIVRTSCSATFIACLPSVTISFASTCIDLKDSTRSAKAFGKPSSGKKANLAGSPLGAIALAAAASASALARSSAAAASAAAASASAFFFASSSAASWLRFSTGASNEKKPPTASPSCDLGLGFAGFGRGASQRTKLAGSTSSKPVPSSSRSIQTSPSSRLGLLVGAEVSVASGAAPGAASFEAGAADAPSTDPGVAPAGGGAA
mmetsp:Transcript_72424/g.132254  ORF Transcript_72424/g.132254 Transcript_72424/m.132254 type:complete len:322 (-) Transcript_72424:690-1655(-)